MTPFQQFSPGGTTTATQAITISDRDRIMAVIANPSEHGAEVREAVRVLVTAGRSTADLVSWRLDTAGMSSQFQSLIDLVNETLNEVDSDAHHLLPDVPQYVPVDWAETLNVRAVEDTEFRLPWLEDL